jgi:hypothetical protein
LSTFKGLGLLAALSKSNAASITLLLDSRSAPMAKPFSRLGRAESIPNIGSSLTEPSSWFIQSSDEYRNGITVFSLWTADVDDVTDGFRT